MADEKESPFDARHFAREDESEDARFYTEARLVLHIDEAASAALKRYYARIFPAGGRILDLMSSYASHLFEDHGFASVTGLGMNLPELEANAVLDERVVHDLNAGPVLPFEDGRFDACMINVSVQYLTSPVDVFRDIARVLAPGGMLHVTFSNRIFPEKAIALWRGIGDQDHARLVAMYFGEAGVWERPVFEDLSPNPGVTDPIYVVRAARK